MPGQKGNKNRKYGRSKRHPSTQRYHAEMRWVKNKKRRVARHVRKNPNDKSNASRLAQL